jgi:hypothetical protein
MIAACAALALGAVAAGAQTTQDRTTFVTFSGPVSIPGKTLPAGTYTFRLADSQADRHIVQILEKDSQNVIATMLAVPADRAEADGDPVVTFKETPADQPPAVRYWYYAGERAGNEFVYPKDQAIMIARASGESVMSIDSSSSSVDDMKKAEMSRVTGAEASAPASASTQPDQPPVAPEPTTPRPAQPAQPATPEPSAPQSATPQSAAPPAAEPTTPPASAAPTPDQDRPVGTSGRSGDELPGTASELPAIALLGLLALGGGLTARVARRRLI